MAEGFLKSFGDDLQVYSAGTHPAYRVHPKAVEVMKESGIDLSRNKTKSVFEFLSQAFDYVITGCARAKEPCPVFTGKVGNRLRMGFEGPAGAVGSEEEILSAFRDTRDRIRDSFYEFYMREIRNGRRSG